MAWKVELGFDFFAWIFEFGYGLSAVACACNVLGPRFSYVWEGI